MTLSQIRRRIDALMRKFARELAIMRAREVAEAVSNDWNPDEPPAPAAVINRISKAGFRYHDIRGLRRYLDDTLRRQDVPEPLGIVFSLLPWANDDRYEKLLFWDLPARERRQILLSD